MTTELNEGGKRGSATKGTSSRSSQYARGSVHLFQGERLQSFADAWDHCANWYREHRGEMTASEKTSFAIWMGKLNSASVTTALSSHYLGRKLAETAEPMGMAVCMLTWAKENIRGVKACREFSNRFLS